MLLVLEPSDGDKAVSLYAYNLAGESDYTIVGYKPDLDSERVRFNIAVLEEYEPIAAQCKGRRFIKPFNQVSRQGTSGWEHGPSDFREVVLHALKVAAALDQPLLVHIDLMQKQVLSALIALAITFEYDFAAPVAEVHPCADIDSLNRRLGDDKYFALTGIQYHPGVDVQA